MHRNLRTLRGPLAVGLAVGITTSLLPIGVASQEVVCAPLVTVTPAVPAGGASGSITQPGPAPGSPQACWTWSMQAYTMNADANEIVVVGDAVVTVAHGSEVVALEAASGEERWLHDIADVDYGTINGLTAGEDVVYVGGIDGLDALAVADGTPRWRYEVDNTESPNPGWGGFFHPAPVAGSVFGTTRVDAADGTSSITLVALDAATGTPRWSVPLTTESADPVASDGTIVVASYVRFGDDELRWPNLGAFDAATGASLWVREIRDIEQWPTTRPVMTASHAFLGSQNGDIAAYGLADGKRAWKSNVGRNVGSIMVAGSTLYATSGSSELHALNVKNGKRRWKKALKEAYFATGVTPAVVEGGPLVMFASKLDTSGQLYALDPTNGKQVWRTDAGPVGADSGSPVVAGGRIVLMLNSSEAANVMSFGSP
jgi:outer membrane protein assembly factor BamB